MSNGIFGCKDSHTSLHLQNPVRTRSKLFYQDGSGMQDFFENLKIVPLEDQADDVYQ